VERRAGARRGIGDLLLAPDASRPEQAVVYAAALTATALTLVAGAHAGLAWWALLLTAVIAFDVVGGAVAHALPSVTRRFHRPGRSARHRLAFVAAHVHPFVLALVLPDLGWASAALIYGGVLGGAVLTALTPPALRLVVAVAVTAAGPAVLLTIAPVPSPVTWLAPLLLLKLVLGHVADGARQRSPAGAATS